MFTPRRYYRVAVLQPDTELFVHFTAFRLNETLPPLLYAYITHHNHVAFVAQICLFDLSCLGVEIRYPHLARPLGKLPLGLLRWFGSPLYR